MPFQQPVKMVMKAKVTDILETDTVSKALQILDEGEISAVPVRSADGTYKGVLSRTDIASLRFFSVLKGRGGPEYILVHEVMNKTPPIFVREETTIKEAAAIMHRRHIHRLFVAGKNNQLIGVVSTSDILRMVVVSIDRPE